MKARKLRARAAVDAALATASAAAEALDREAAEREVLPLPK